MPKMIFITGGSASGKTTLANQMKEKLGDSAILISQDSFYKPTKSESVNFDEPKAFDWELQRETFGKLVKGCKTIDIPIYSFISHSREGAIKIKTAPVIIFEGLFTFHDEELLSHADLKIFVDTPADTRLGRRVMRDVHERGRDVKEVVDRWNKDVQPSYRKYISNTKINADMIIPWTIVNERATDFLASTIEHLRAKDTK